MPEVLNLDSAPLLQATTHLPDASWTAWRLPPLGMSSQARRVVKLTLDLQLVALHAPTAILELQ